MKTNCFFTPGFLFSHKLFLGLMMVIFLLIAGGCASQEKYRVVEFTGAEYMNNYSRFSVWNHFIADTAGTSAILCSENDLLSCNDFMLVQNSDFQLSGKNHLLFDDNIASVNEKIFAVNISSQTNMMPWFEAMEAKDLSSLQFINFEDEPTVDYLPFLKKLLEIKPDAGLYLPLDEQNEFSSVYEIFNPRYLIGFDYNLANRHLLQRYTNLELLWLDLFQEEKTEPLPALPKVKQLMVCLTDAEILPADFLVHNRQIEKVMVVGTKGKQFDFLPLTHLKKLSALTVIDVDSFINPQLINSHPNLTFLHLCTCPHPEAINLSRLKWMTFPAEITQEQFTHFLSMHPRLEVVELNNQNISDLHHLAGLNRLKGLIVTDTITDLATVKSLSRLEFLSLPTDYTSNMSLMSELQNALPNTHLVANEGFCLGSGWLLLIYPLVLLFWIIHTKKIQRKMFHP